MKIRKITLLGLFLIFFLMFSISCGRFNESAERVNSSGEKNDSKIVNLPQNLRNALPDKEIYRENSVVFTIKNSNEIFYGAKQDAVKKEELGKKFDDYWDAMKTLSNDEKVVYIAADSSVDYGFLIEIFRIARQKKIENIRFVVNPNQENKGTDVLQAVLIKEPKKNVSEKPNPLMLTASIEKDGQINLNGDKGNLEKIKARLAEVFRNREQNGVYRENTNKVEKTVIVKGLRSAKYGEIAKLLDGLSEVRANPIVLEIDNLTE